MASSLALKRLAASNLFTKSLRPVAASSQSISRLFNTNALSDYEDNDRSSERNVSSRCDFPPNPFSGCHVFDPFATTRSLNQILNLVDRFDSTLLSRPRGGIGGGIKRDWEAKETADGLYLRMDMPGLGKEDVKVWVEQNTLIIKGEAEESEEDEDVSGRRYSSRIDLPEKVYKTNEIRAEMKNGVLKVLVPKVKEEERSDVFHVAVD